MEKLISMVDFVLDKQRIKEDSDTAIFNVTNYANFLKQPLSIEMFVPCKLVDDIWVVLEESNQFNYNMDATPIENKYFDDMEEYKQAKERCLFERFEFIGNECVLNSNLMIHFLNNEISIEEHFEKIITKLSKPVNTIEDLIKYNLTLTKTAQKKLGL